MVKMGIFCGGEKIMLNPHVAWWKIPIGHSYGLRSFHIAYGKCFMDDKNLYHPAYVFTSLKCWFCL